jgi:hypothetical protein
MSPIFISLICAVLTLAVVPLLYVVHPCRYAERP